MGGELEHTSRPSTKAEPFVWGATRSPEERETQDPHVAAENLRALVARWNLATGIAAAPAFHQLLARWGPVHAPEIPITLLVAFSKVEASGWNDATRGTPANGYTSPPFYELGVFQVPAGLHGRCTRTQCEHAPPGVEAPGSPSAWGKLCAHLNLDPKNWTDPTTQVRVGLANLEHDASVIRRRYPELFPRPGTEWDLRAAVLLPFVGIGTADRMIKAYRAQLSRLPENDRWGFLTSQAIGQQPDARRAARLRELLDNVEKKMRLHTTLTAHFGRGPSGPTQPTASSARPASSRPDRPAGPVTSGATPAPSAGAGGIPSSPTLPDVTRFAAQLGAAWAARRNGSPSGEAIRDWLLKDHQATISGAMKRFGDGYTRAALSRAWMISRAEQMRFRTLPSSGPAPLQPFNPPSDSGSRVSSALIKGSEREKVAPVMVRFVEGLRRRYPSVTADTYRGHGGGSFQGKGYSIDLWLASGRDDRGFYKTDDAIALLRAVNAAARAVGLEWRVLYNDFSVADVINREAGVQRVVFVGQAGTSGINWHGPHPLILHFHLDLGARRAR